MRGNFILESVEVLGYIVEYAIDTRDYSIWFAYTSIAEVLRDISSKDISKAEDCNKILRGVSTLPSECFLYINETIYISYLAFVGIELYEQAVNLLTGSLLEVRPMSISKLQGLRPKISMVDEWLTGDTREDVMNLLSSCEPEGGGQC